MREDPTNSELAWRLSELQRTLDQLVGRAEYAARLEAAERRFADLASEVHEINQRITDHEEHHRASSLSWRTIAYTTIPPTLVAILAIAAQIMINAWRH